MKNTIPLTFLLSMMLSLASWSQSRESDSLLAWQWSEKSWKLREVDPDSSYLLASKAFQLASLHGLKRIMAYSLADIGMFYLQNEEWEKAKDTLNYSLKLRKEYADTNDILSALNNLGVLYNHWERYDSAIVCFDRALVVAESKSNETMLGALLHGQSTAFINMGKFDAAENPLKRSIQIARSRNDSSALAKRLHTLGKLHQKIHRYELALENYHLAGEIYSATGNMMGIIDIYINQGAMALLTNEYAKAIIHFEQARKLSEQHGFEVNLATIYNNLGLAYQFNGHEALVEESFDKAIRIAEEKQRDKTFLEASLNLMTWQLGRRKYRQVIEAQPAMLELIQRKGFDQYYPEYYSIQAQAWAGLGLFDKAFAAQQQFRHYNDSLSMAMDETQRLLAQSERELRDAEILKKQNQLQRETIDRQEVEEWNRLLIIIVLLVLLGSAIGYLLLRNRNLHIRSIALAEKKKSDEKVKELLAGINQQMLETQIEANHETSFKIGQNLHDNLGSKLAVVQTSMEGIRKKVGSSDQNIAERFDKVEQLLEQSCDDLRNIAHDLQDRELNHHGLVYEMEQYTEMINKAGAIAIHFKKGDLPLQLSINTQREVIAIARLLLENVLRHASAREVTIELQAENEYLILQVVDNGVGFDSGDNVASGRGLRNAHARAENLGGQFELISKPGLGTKAILRVPINNIKLK